MTTLSLLIPTHREDRPLRRALESVRAQLLDDDEVLVVGDTHDGALPGVEALVAEFGHPYRYLEHDAGGHDFGHSQLNYAITQAKGDYIHVNDDDDIYTPDALQAFREMTATVHAPIPFLFRFKSYVGGIVRIFAGGRGWFPVRTRLPSKPSPMVMTRPRRP